MRQDLENLPVLDLEIVEFLEQLHLLFVLLPQQGTSDVQQSPRGLQEFQGFGDDLLLQDDVGLDPVLAELELDVWVAAKSSSSSARRVNDHPVHLAERDLHQALLVVMKLHVGDSCP